MKAKKCTEKRDARAKLLFCQSKPSDFLTFSLTSPSSLLKLPNLSFVTLYSSYLAPGGWRPGPSKDTVYLLRDGWQFLPSVYFAPFSCEMGSLNGAYLTRIR